MTGRLTPPSLRRAGTGRPTRRRRTRASGALLSALLLAVPGCTRNRAAEPRKRPQLPKISRGTVGEYVRFSSIRTMPVSGYGLVIGLKGTGSESMPAGIRRRLLREMYRGGISDAEAARILDSRNTAACLVRGTVMPYHTRGSRFDVEVIALPNTQTKSLEGGTLVKTPLAPTVRDVKGQRVLGAPVAYAHGPVLIRRPPGREKQKTPLDPRRGVVIGGGRFSGERKLTLELIEPNLRMCLLIEDAINTRFPRSAKAHSRRLISTEAYTPGRKRPKPEPGMTPEPPPTEMQYYLRVNVPPAYKERWIHFTQVVASIYLDRRPVATALRTRFLIDKLRDPKDRVAACFGLEALGQPAVEPLAKLLDDPDRDIRVSAATVLIALGDSRGVPVLIQTARDPAAPQRMAAIGALSRTNDLAALNTLKELCAESDATVRIAAYEALRRMPDQMVVEHLDRIAFQDQEYEIRGFGIDLVHVKGPPLIVANASNDPRLIFFGDDVRLKPPFFFDEGRYWAIAGEGARVITIRPPQPQPRRPLIRKPFTVPLNVLHYVVVMDSLGATYPDILRRLEKADQLGRIAGRFLIREPAPQPVLERSLD